LKPEESLGYDAGIEQTMWGGRVVFDVTAFASRTTNLIQFATNGYENVASARTFGFESGLSVDVTDTFGIAAHHTYLEARDNGSDTTLRRRAKHAGRIGPFWDVTDDLRLDVDWVAEGRRPDGQGIYLGGYGRVDMRVSYDLTSSLRLSGRIENLFDKAYEEVNGYGTAGVSAYAGLTVTF